MHALTSMLIRDTIRVRSDEDALRSAAAAVARRDVAFPHRRCCFNGTSKNESGHVDDGSPPLSGTLHICNATRPRIRRSSSGAWEREENEDSITAVRAVFGWLYAEWRWPYRLHRQDGAESYVCGIEIDSQRNDDADFTADARRALTKRALVVAANA
ncbi:hypothetical protein MRX96_032909 [Rhipicephalus microplus]